MNPLARRRIPARLLQSAFDACPLPVAMSEQRVLVAVNPAMMRLFGYAPEELLGQTSRKLFASDAAFESTAAQYAAASTRKEPCAVDTELLARDGSRLACRVWFRAVDFRDPDRGVVGVIEPLGEQARVEAELRQSEERLQLALEGSELALWDADACSGAVFLSERWAEMIGAPPGETRTTVRELLTIAHPEDRERVLAAVLAVAKGQRTHYAEEHRVRAANGEWRWILSRGRVAERAPGGRALRMIGTNTDIHERKRTEDTLVAQAVEIAAKNRELEASNRFKSEFIARMAHELRTPLAAVLGFADLIEKAGDDAARMQGYAREVRIAGERLRLVVDDILELAGIEAARTPFAPQPVAPQHCIEAALRGAASLAERSGVALASRVAPDLPLLPADERKLVIALGHLLDNAVKHSARGGTVTLAARLAGARMLDLSVEDRGAGIAPEVLPQLFEPLVQGEDVLTRRHGGTGLGLALVKRIAELHGGTVDVESTPGEGSTFTLRLPVGIAKG